MGLRMGARERLVRRPVPKRQRPGGEGAAGRVGAGGAVTPAPGILLGARALACRLQMCFDRLRLYS